MVAPFEMIAAYASLFVHRWDSYAVQQRNGDYWRAAEPVTLDHLDVHLAGRFTLGTYLLDCESCCSFAVFDDDSDGGVERLAVLGVELARLGIPTVHEASRRGSHLWVHFVEPTPAWAVRAWLLPYAQDFGVELYPKQDALRVGGSGSLIRLPLGVHRRSGGWYPFVQVSATGSVEAVGQTVVQNIAWVTAAVERVQVPVQREAAALPAREQKPFVQGSPCRSGGGVGSIRDWCYGQNIVEVVGRYVVLDGRGIGCCPFSGHHTHGDARPSFQVFGGNDPHWYCYTWGRAGNVFDFLCLYHGLTAQQAWGRVQAGTLV